MKELHNKAYNLGVEASRKGLKMIPYLDSNLLELLKGLKVGESSKIFDYWSKGYIERDIIDNII